MGMRINQMLNVTSVTWIMKAEGSKVFLVKNDKLTERSEKIKRLVPFERSISAILKLNEQFEQCGETSEGFLETKGLNEELLC